MVIIDAALTCFAAEGYAGATTAAICRQAGIGSGTFFHYFPTKADVLLAILALGTQETAAWFAEQEGRDDARVVLLDWVRHTAEELADPRLPGFVQAVSSVMTEPRVAAALRADESAQHDGLLTWVRRARRAGQVRSDLTARDLSVWVQLIVDGYVGRLAGHPEFGTRRQRRVLVETVARVLDA